jgi:hypothetical protein
VVGITGFEPATSWSRTKRSTRLSYIPNRRAADWRASRSDARRQAGNLSDIDCGGREKLGERASLRHEPGPFKSRAVGWSGGPPSAPWPADPLRQRVTAKRPFTIPRKPSAGASSCFWGPHPEQRSEWQNVYPGLPPIARDIGTGRAAAGPKALPSESGPACGPSCSATPLT